MSDLKFGTSGLRGLVSDMTDQACGTYVDAFLRHLEASGAVRLREALVGRDLRDSSPVIADACMRAIHQAGFRAIDCGALPTPALALEAFRRRVPAIMVTGSHIPADRNGLKFYRPDGEITKRDETGILAQLEPGYVLGSIRLDENTDNTAMQRYRERYVAWGQDISLSGMRLGVYQHSSVARDLIADVLSTLGAQCIALGRSDRFMPVDTEALSEADRSQAANWAREHRLDALVSTDGDADRPLIADENGAFLRGDVVGILTARFLAADIVVTPVTSTSAVEMSGFKTTRRTRVGSPYVIEGMTDGVPGVVVGFEANGGVLLGTDVNRDNAALARLPTRDALLPILAVLLLSKREGQPISHIVGSLPARFTASDRLQHVSSDVSAGLLAMISDRQRAQDFLGAGNEVTQIDLADGTKITLESGDTVHFRASGNAPELRCYAEAGTQERANQLLTIGLAKARSAIGTNKSGLD